MTDNIIEAVLKNEASPSRFETFCRELLEASEGITLVPTSYNYDQGRDARSIGPSEGSHQIVLCATIDTQIDDKVNHDATLLAKTSQPEHVYYCYSKRLTEHKIDELTASVRAAFSYAPGVTFLALKQIIPLAARHAAILEKHYKSDLQSIDATLHRLETGEERNDAGLRLALMTLASEDARNLREEIAGKAVLHVLCAATTPLSVPAIAEHLSKDLGLPASLQASLIESALANLQAGSLVEPVSNQQWGITEAGLTQVASLSTEAATDILAGANVVRSTLETLTGYKLHESQFSLLWSTLLDYWSQLFHTNGLSVISAINDFTSGHAGASVHLESLVGTGAARIRSIFAIPEMGDAIAQAVFDILTERTGPAFDWLSKVCERFVALCSLGLEASSTEELRRVIAHYTLVLDSDVVITAMCQGERGHHATRELLGKWTRLGGRLMVPVPVLEEVAYHAYVSQRDFQETKELAPGLNGLDLIRYCSNAFVRAFYTVEKDPQHWANFRAMYAGEKPHDYSKILDILRDQMVVEFMQANCDPDLSASIKRYLLTISSEQEQAASNFFGDPGRTGRDGQLLAAIARAREGERQAGSEKRMVLLSSSTRLRMADERFRNELGTPEAVMSRGAVSYMLSLIPEAGLGIVTLRKALFDFGETAHLADTERFALRVIRTAGSYTMPWAQRSHMRRELERNIRREAEKAGMPAKQMALKFVAGDQAVRPEHLIAKTIKDMALEDPEKALLRGKIRQLEADLQEAARKVAPPVQRTPRDRRRRRRK